MGITYVWFDLGYTLVYTRRELVMARLLYEFQLNAGLDRIHTAFHLTDKLFMRERQGLLCKSKEEFMPLYLQQLFKILQVEIDVKTALSRLESLENDQKKYDGRSWFAFADAIEVLSALRSRSIMTGLISNWDGTAREVLAQNELHPLLDEVVVSSEVRVAKPDKEIFNLALQRAGVAPEECLYVGDNFYDDVVGSRKVGMASVLINPYGMLGVEELADAGVDVIPNIGSLLSYIEEKFDLRQIGRAM